MVLPARIFLYAEKMEVFIMNIDYQLLGNRIAQLRKNRKITQERLAEKAEISNNYLSNIENNHSIPSLETVMKLCMALDVTPNELLLGISKNEKHYLSGEILQKLNSCTSREKRLIDGFINLLIQEREEALS